MDIIVVVASLATISFSALTMYKVSLLRNVIHANDNLESMIVKKTTEAISSVYKENKKLREEIKQLNCDIKNLDIDKAILTEKLEKITKQIDSFNKVFK
jgi:cell division protein FtsB